MERERFPRTILVPLIAGAAISMAVLGCSGDTGPAGLQGPQGPQGPPGDPGPGMVAVYSGQFTALPSAPQIVPVALDTLDLPLIAVYVRSDEAPEWYQVGGGLDDDPRFFATDFGVFIFADVFTWDEWRVVLVFDEAEPIVSRLDGRAIDGLISPHSTRSADRDARRTGWWTWDRDRSLAHRGPVVRAETWT